MRSIAANTATGLVDSTLEMLEHLLTTRLALLDLGTSTFDDFLNDNTFGDGGGEDDYDASLKDSKTILIYLQPANSYTPGGSSTASDD